MRLHLMLACLALMPDGCESGPSAVKSLYPLVSDSAASCEPVLTGAWVRDADSTGPVVWVVLGSDPSDSTCTLELVLSDSSVARAVLDTPEGRWLQGDSTTRAEMDVNAATREMYLADQSKLEALLEPEEEGDSALTVWEVRAVRRGAYLFLDISRDEVQASPWGDTPIRTHWLWRADLEADRLTLKQFSRIWLQAMSDSGRVMVAHAELDGEFVLTARGEELVALMERFAADTEAFPEHGAIHLRR